MRLIGLTGSIASGKSTVSNRLRELGACVLDADAVSREVTAKGSIGLEKIEAEFSGVTLPDGSLDRKCLASLVFVSEERLKTLNSILHPLIMNEMRERTHELMQQNERIVVWDVPLLIEIGADREVDEVWLVVADDEIRLRRAMARDGATRERVLLRMAAQSSQEEKKLCATVIIENDGSVAELISKVDALYYALRTANE